MRFPLSREKAWQRAFLNLGSNRREVTLKFASKFQPAIRFCIATV